MEEKTYFKLFSIEMMWNGAGDNSLNKYLSWINRARCNFRHSDMHSGTWNKKKYKPNPNNQRKGKRKQRTLNETDSEQSNKQTKKILCWKRIRCSSRLLLLTDESLSKLWLFVQVQRTRNSTWKINVYYIVSSLETTITHKSTHIEIWFREAQF